MFRQNGWFPVFFMCLFASCSQERETENSANLPQQREQAGKTAGRFGIFWPPRDLDRPADESKGPFLHGELLVETTDGDQSDVIKISITLTRPNGETDRVRWNKTLAFPQYAWMSRVRVWDRKRNWLWPNLPYLLRAHGQERVDRYGGIDPGSGVDNDFAAVLIRPLETESAESTPPLVSAEWHVVDVENPDRNSIVHTARSDEFRIHLAKNKSLASSVKLGVWLIFADFLGANPPRKWPAKKEFDGGILAYLEVRWQRKSDGELQFNIKPLVPPKDTGFDWASWSTALEKNLEMIYPNATNNG